MSQIVPPSSSTKILMLQLYSRPSPFHVGEISIYAMPNAGYRKIDLNALYTKQKKYHVQAKKQLYIKKTMSRLSQRKTDRFNRHFK